MPPSGHSSSSHRSHSSSSHSHSSSRSSSSHSHSSSYGSGYGGSSGYGHSTSSSHYSSGRYGSGRGGQNDSVYPDFTRTRSNQPKGYHIGVKNYVRPKGYHCKRHDYIYYGTGWVDDKTGITYQSGYYDENGRRYGSLPKDDPLDVREEKLDFSWKSDPEQFEKDQREDFWQKVGDFFLMALPIIGWILIGAAMYGVYYMDENIWNVSDSTNSYYVEELGRECKWSDEYDSYYDAETDCYFWFNDEIEYPAWQYWYEGISSNYGDYGWMEYDEEKNSWYIEVKKGRWERLPEEYNTSRLWYIHEE